MAVEGCPVILSSGSGETVREDLLQWKCNTSLKYLHSNEVLHEVAFTHVLPCPEVLVLTGDTAPGRPWVTAAVRLRASSTQMGLRRNRRPRSRRRLAPMT